jgi:hypothetical protein
VQHLDLLQRALFVVFHRLFLPLLLLPELLVLQSVVVLELGELQLQLFLAA